MAETKGGLQAPAAGDAGNELKVVDLKASGHFADFAPDAIMPTGPSLDYFSPPRMLCVRFLGVANNAHIKLCGPRDAQVVALASVSGSTASLSVIEDMDDLVTLEIGSEADKVTLTLEIEGEIKGAATLRLSSLSTRMAFPDDGPSELNIVPPKDNNAAGADSAGKFLLHAHWEDDSHVLREMGSLYYRVIEKRGIKLMRSPWLQSLKTREKVKVGEMVTASERLTDLDGNVWVKLSKADDQPAGREGWMIEADGDKRWLERLTRKWTKAAAANVIQKRARGKSDRFQVAQIRADIAEAEAKVRAAESAAVELEQKRNKAAVMVQKVMWGIWSKNYVRDRMSKALTLQAWGRMVLDRWWFSRVKAACIRLQLYIRWVQAKAAHRKWMAVMMRLGGRFIGIRYRYPKAYFSCKSKRFYWGPIRRGFHVQKSAATTITSLFRTAFMRSWYLMKKGAAMTIQNVLARPFFARVKLCDILTAQVEPRVVLLNQMQRANNHKITIWRRLVNRLAHPSALGIKGSTRVVVIAGGTDSGIAKRIAELFVADESKTWLRTAVIIAGPKEPPMKKIGKAMMKKNKASYVSVGSVVFKKADLLTEAGVASLFSDIVAEYRKIDVLVNNVSVDVPDQFDFIDKPKNGTTIAGYSAFAERPMPRNHPDRLLDVERLQTPFICMQASVPYLRASKGIIVNVLPPETLESQRLLISKPGLMALTDFIAKAYPEIKCNAIKPVVTPYAPDGRQDIGTAIAKMTAFLVAEDSPFITGQDFAVQGFAPEDAPPPKTARDAAKQKLLDALKTNGRYNISALSLMMDPSDI